MKKRVASKVSVASKLLDSRAADDSNDVTRRGLFTFPNGDSYDGEYKIYGGQPMLFRHGRGVYCADDFNRYEAVWDRDRISSDLHIRFNNAMEYKGGLDEDGFMSGLGSYFLPDGSSIEAIWNKNKPSLDIRYKEPVGFIWKGQLSADGNEIRFSDGNHFWDDMIDAEDYRSEIPELDEGFKANLSSKELERRNIE